MARHHILGITIERADYSPEQKERIVKHLLSGVDFREDFERLRNNDVIGAFSPRGLDVVNSFTLVERLNTVAKTGISFYDLWRNKALFKKKPYVAKMIARYAATKGVGENDIKMWFRIYNLYYGAISVFRPSIAMSVYSRFKPTSVLDFTMGWGGRLVGACALDVPNYIGIDSNTNLREPYRKMVSFLKPLTKTKTTLFFKDALSVNYDALDYDMVLTSPPYFNIERYANQPNRSKENWISEFYEPLFAKTFAGMRRGGHYCLNIPDEIYRAVALPLFGRPSHRIPMPKYKRQQTEEYKEWIYVWRKN
jgi:hypothetical protein